MKLLIRISILTILFSIFAVRCANPGTLTGGLKDTLAPQLVRTSPNNYTTNFRGKKIMLEFDEYIQLKDQSKLFFVSPPGTKKPRLTVKGKSIEVLFETDLDSATTYRLDFGRSIVDNNEGNKMDDFSFVFSTGAVIDSLAMAGQAIGAYERDSIVNAFIFFFDPRLDSLGADHVSARRDSLFTADSTMFSPRIEKALGLFRTDSSGYFVADILKDKDYTIYALDDTNGDQKYQPGLDRVGFMDRKYNPSKLGGFSLVYDSAKKYMVIDSLQARFELFKEIPVRRQLLTKQERPLRQKIVMNFNAIQPVTDSLKLEGIEPEWLMGENSLLGDTLTLWIAPPSLEQIDKLSDTIRGTIILQKEDSVWQTYRSTEKLAFNFKTINLNKKKEEKRIESIAKISKKNKRKAAKSMAQDTLMADSLTVDPKTIESEKAEEPVVENKFKYKVIADKELNPENHIVFDFDYPLRSVDTSRVQLIHIQKIEGKGRNAKTETREVPVPFELENNPNNLRRWVLRSKWKKSEEYKLSIPAKVFTDITFEANDSLESTFTIADPDKFGELIFETDVDSTDNNQYIYELVQGSGVKMTILSRKTGFRAGEAVPFSYLKSGTYFLRVIQDVNGNGRWDTGSLTERRQPEKVRMVTGGDQQRKPFLAKENWQVKESVNLQKLFEE